MPALESVDPQDAESSMFFARLISRAFLSLVIIFLIGAISLVVAADGGMPLVGGAASSAVALWVFTIRVHCEASSGQVEKSWGGTFAGLCALLPYLFGCYLVFYRGFLGLTDLSTGSSWLILARTCCFVLLGFAIVNGTHKVSMAARAVTLGRPKNSASCPSQN